MFNTSSLQSADQGSGFSPFRFLRRGVVLAFAVIQILLGAPLLLDRGGIPPRGGGGGFFFPWGATRAAPVGGAG